MKCKWKLKPNINKLETTHITKKTFENPGDWTHQQHQHQHINAANKCTLRCEYLIILRGMFVMHVSILHRQPASTSACIILVNQGFPQVPHTCSRIFSVSLSRWQIIRNTSRNHEASVKPHKLTIIIIIIITIRIKRLQIPPLILA